MQPLVPLVFHNLPSLYPPSFVVQYTFGTAVHPPYLWSVLASHSSWYTYGRVEPARILTHMRMRGGSIGTYLFALTEHQQCKTKIDASWKASDQLTALCHVSSNVIVDCVCIAVCSYFQFVLRKEYSL